MSGRAGEPEGRGEGVRTDIRSLTAYTLTPPLGAALTATLHMCGCPHTSSSGMPSRTAFSNAFDACGVCKSPLSELRPCTAQP